MSNDRVLLLSFAALLLVLVLSIINDLPSHPPDFAPRSDNGYRIEGLRDELVSYASHHNGKFPDQLSDILKDHDTQDIRADLIDLMKSPTLSYFPPSHSALDPDKMAPESPDNQILLYYQTKSWDFQCRIVGQVICLPHRKASPVL